MTKNVGELFEIVVCTDCKSFSCEKNKQQKAQCASLLLWAKLCR